MGTRNYARHVGLTPSNSASQGGHKTGPSRPAHCASDLNSCSAPQRQPRCSGSSHGIERKDGRGVKRTVQPSTPVTPEPPNPGIYPHLWCPRSHSHLSHTRLICTHGKCTRMITDCRWHCCGLFVTICFPKRMQLSQYTYNPSLKHPHIHSFTSNQLILQLSNISIHSFFFIT